MEGSKEVQTRSVSALGEYPPLNNQRQPLIGEFVRVRLPSDKKYHNIHSHGWVIAKVEFSYAIRPESDEGEDYIIKGTKHDSNKVILVCLAMRGNEDDLDSRAKQGWDIVDVGEDPATGMRHNARMQHSQHPDNKATAQRVIMEEEYQRYAIEALNITTSQREDNLYETPQLPPRQDQELQSIRTRLTPRRGTPIPDKEHYGTSIPETSIHEPSAPSLASFSSSNLEAATGTWTIQDNSSNKMLGKSFDDSLATITSMDADLLDSIDALPGAVLTESKLMQLTNRARQFLESETWLKDPISVKKYINIRNKWFFLATKYKNQRSNVLYTIETNLQSFINDPTTDQTTQKLLLELCESGQFNNFVNALRQVDARMSKLDESVSRLQQDQFESLGSIFEFEDHTQNMDERTLARFSDEDISKPRKTTPKKHIGTTSDDDFIDDPKGRHRNTTRISTKEHWALRGLGDADKGQRTDLTVNMMTGTGGLSHSQVGDGSGEGRVLSLELENMLYQSLLELTKEIKSLDLDIRESTEEMKGVEPSNHTDNIMKLYDRKVEKVSETKEKLYDTYRRYIEEYNPSTGMATIGEHTKNVSSVLSELRQHLQKFGRMARTRVDFEEISYQRQRDTRAPELRVDVFKGETSLASYLTWISKNGKLPNNLLNANIRKTLPSIVLERLNLQHPEGSRSPEDVITFLLKSYGRTGQMEVQLREYHIDIGSLNPFFLAGHEESINPNMCKEVITNADLHLVGLRSVFSLRDLCKKYLGIAEADMWFEENLLTHAYTTWAARCILTCSQINRMSQMRLNCEDKLKWVITKVEELRDVADRLICSGMAGSLQGTPTTNSVLMTNRIDPVQPKVDVADPKANPPSTTPNHVKWASHGSTHPRDRLHTHTWGTQQNRQPYNGNTNPPTRSTTWDPNHSMQGRNPLNSQQGNANWNTRNTSQPNERVSLKGSGDGTQQAVRTTSYPEAYNRFLAGVFKDAIIHDCNQGTDCADRKTIEYTENWFGNRIWFVIDRIRQNSSSRTGNDFLFDEPKFRNMCDAQKRRIAYLLGSPNPCSICTNHLTTSTQSVPLPHFMYSPQATRHNFRNGKCKIINWPLGCTQVLKEDDPNGKVRELQRRNIIDGCPAACTQQFSMSYADGYEPIKLCRESRCQGFQPSGTLQRLKGEFQDIIRSNNVDFTTASGKVLILVSIYETQRKKMQDVEPSHSTERQLLYGTQGELFNDLRIKPIRKRKSPFLFIHYNIQSQSGDQSLLKAFQDTCCSSTAIRDEIAGRDITGSIAEDVILEVAGSRRTKEQSLDYLLNYEDQNTNTIKMNNAILVDKIIQDQPLQDTSHQVDKLLKEMKQVCQQHNVEFQIDEENVPRQYGGQLDLLIGNSVFELTKVYTSSWGMSLYHVPLKINGKKSYAIGGYLHEEKGFEQSPELFTRILGSINVANKDLVHIDSANDMDTESHLIDVPPLTSGMSDDTHTMLVMATLADDYQDSPIMQDNNRPTDDLKLPKFPKDYTLGQILHQLQLFQPTTSTIDASGSCGYDTIWQQVKDNLNNLPPKIMDHLDPEVQFPIRKLAAKLLRLPLEDQPWRDIFELFRATTLDEINKRYIRLPIKEANDIVADKWQTLADGNEWIDTHVIKLLAISLEHDIFIFQHQPNSRDKLVLHPVTSEQTRNVQRPILMLLSHSHFTPLEPYTSTDEWYMQSSLGLNPPWSQNAPTNITPYNPARPVKPTNTSNRNWANVVRFGTNTPPNPLSNIESSESTTSTKGGLNDIQGSQVRDKNINSKEKLCMPGTKPEDTTPLITIKHDVSPWITVNKGFKSNRHQRNTLTHNTITKLQKIRNYWDSLTWGEPRQEENDSEDLETEEPIIEQIIVEGPKKDGQTTIESPTTASDVGTEGIPIKPKSNGNPSTVGDGNIKGKEAADLTTGPASIDRPTTSDTCDPKEDKTGGSPKEPWTIVATPTKDLGEYKQKPIDTSPSEDQNNPTKHDDENHTRNRPTDTPPLPTKTPTVPHVTLITTSGDRDKPISDIALQAKMFDDKLDIKARCTKCRECRLCSPFITIPTKVKENLERNEENITIRKFMSITYNENGTKKFVTRMPCEQHIIDEELQGSNRTDVISANDRKLRQLNADQRIELWEEFQKLNQMGYIQAIENLPTEVQEKLNEAKAQYYIAVAPSFKSTSCSTSTRCAFDASMINKSTRKSLNNVLPTGHTGINLCQTFRNFRIGPIGLACDLRKYYNSIEVHEDSYPINRIIFRDNADPSGTLREYILKNLFYGIKPAGSITDEALKFVAREAVLQCSECTEKATTNSHTNEAEGSTTDIRKHSEGEVYIQRIDDRIYKPECPAVNHEFYKLLERKYVDDILASTYTTKRVEEIKQFTESKLSEYSFSTKGWNITGDERTPGTNNLNDDNKLGACSYLWNPHTDRFKPKEILLHNGIKFRGALKPMKDWVRTSGTGQLTPIKAPALRTRVFKEIYEITTDALNELWKDTPRTLRSGLSKTYQLFEPCGFLAPLAGQTRAALHEAVKLNGNNMEREIPERLWSHLIKCIAEMLKAMTFEFERRPDKELITEDCKNILITFTDYSLNMSIVSYLVTITANGKPSVIILQARTLNRRFTVPKGELDGMKEGSIQHKTLVTELGDILSSDYLLTDSMICIYQLINDKEHENPFVENRVREIRQNIDVINKVYHVISSENMADLGTRYGTSTNDTNFISCEAVAPHSTYARGRYWFKDLEEAEEMGIITSAKTLYNEKRKSQEGINTEEPSVQMCMFTTIANNTQQDTTTSDAIFDRCLPELIESQGYYSDDGSDDESNDESDTNRFNSLHNPAEIWTEYFLYNSTEFNSHKTYVQEPYCNCTCPCTDMCTCECTEKGLNAHTEFTTKAGPEDPKANEEPNSSLTNQIIYPPLKTNDNETQVYEDVYHDALDHHLGEDTEVTTTAKSNTTDKEQEIRNYKCGATKCGLELKFRNNLILHCNIEHPNIDDAQLEDWLKINDNEEEGQEDTEQRTKSALLMSITKLHNRRKQENISEDILDQTQTRYWTPGSTDNIKGLHYVNDLRKETFRPFTTNFRTTRMVVKACIGFLRLIKKKLSLLHNFHEHFKYLQADSEEQYLTHGTLKDVTFAIAEHNECIKVCSNFTGLEEDRITNIGARIKTTLKRGSLICLRGTHNNEELLRDDHGIRGHIETKRTMRQVSYLYNKMNSIINRNELSEYIQIWSLIYDILTIHTINAKAKTVLANCAIHDVTEVLTHMIKRDKLTILLRSFEESDRPEHLHWFGGPQNFFISNIVEIPRRRAPKKLDTFDFNDYTDAMKATATLYGIKVNSETNTHAKATDLKTFAVLQDGHWLANKKTSNLSGGSMDPTVEQLLNSVGYGSVSLFHEVFSPTAWSIVRFLHLPDPFDMIMQRRTHSHIPQHLGRPKLLELVEKRYFISKARRVVDIVISMCLQCKLRNQDNEPSPHGRLPLFLLKTDPRPYSCTHIDLAGPVRLLVEKGSRVTRNQAQVACYILVCVCSLTKHTTLLLLDNTDTHSVSLALSALMKRTGKPSLIIADNQSSFVKLMRENTVVTQNKGVIVINRVAIRLVPAGQIGHSHAGTVEKKIDLLRKLIGNFDFTKTSLPITNFQNLLDIAAGAMNKVPIGSRRACKPVQSISDSPLVKFMTPESLYDPRNVPSPETFISIEKDINLYNDTNERMSKFVTELMFGYLIELQNQGLESCENFTCLQVGDVVAFKTRDFLHHHYHHPFTSGIIDRIHNDPIDNIVRTADVSYMARPGEKVFINEEMTVLRSGLHCTTSRPVKTLIKICGKDDMTDIFRRDAARTESWLNSYPTQLKTIETISTKSAPELHRISSDEHEVALCPPNPGKNQLHNELAWRPNQLICTRPSQQCIDKVLDIQEELIERDSDKAKFKVPAEKLHITHLVFSETQDSKQVFEATCNKLSKERLSFNYKLGPLVNYDGNICIKLRSKELPTIQNLYKSGLDLQGIRYDDRQTYHITIFKKKHKLNIEPDLTLLDETSYEMDDTDYSINSIDLCRMKPAEKYFPVIMSYSFNQGELGQHKSDDVETQYEQYQPQLKTGELESQSNPVIKHIVKQHGYNTRQMTRAKGAILLLCLYYLSQNPASAEPGALDASYPDTATTSNTRSKIGRPPANHEQIESQYYQWTLPVMTILLVLWIVIFEIMYALYKQTRSWLKASGKLKERPTQAATYKRKARSLSTVSSHDISLMTHNPNPIRNTRLEGSTTTDNGELSTSDHKAQHQPELPNTLNTTSCFNEMNPNSGRPYATTNKQSRNKTTPNKARQNLIVILCVLPLLGVAADHLDNDIQQLRRSTDYMIATQQQSQQDFERIYTNLASIQPKVDDKRASDLEQLKWIPSHLSTIATLLHQIINAEESARSRMKNDIQMSGIRSMQHIHSSFRTIRRSRKSKRDVTIMQDRVEFKTRRQEDKDSRFIRELKRFFETYDETHRPSARAQQFSLEVQNQFDGNLEELRPIQILMGRSDTSDIRAMESTWMMEIAKLPRKELIEGLLTNDKVSAKVIRTISKDNKATPSPPETTASTTTTKENKPTEATPKGDPTTHSTSGLDSVISLLEELQTLNDMLDPQERDTNEDQTCKPQEPQKPTERPRAPPMCAVYAYQSTSLLKAIDDSRVKIRSLDCHVRDSTKQILNTTTQTEALIRKTTEGRLLQELESIANNENEINEIISRAQVRAGQVNDGMNILTMKIADRHRTMNVLLEQTDKLIHDTIKAEMRRTLGKKARDKRSHLELTHKTPKYGRHKRNQNPSSSLMNHTNQVSALNLASDAGLLPDNMSAGLKTIKTVQDTINTLTNAGNSVYEALSGSGSGQEEEDFLKRIMDEVDAQSKAANEKETTVQEGDAVDIPCFMDETGIDTSAVVWMRSDGGFLYNFQLEQTSDRLQISAVNCNDKGGYRCGIKNGEAWDASNIAETWNLHKLNVLCNVEKKTTTTPSQVIAGEGESATLQCSAPTDVNVQWTKTSGIDKQDFSEQGSSITLQTVSNTDAGIYTCTYTSQGNPIKEHIILQVHKVPTDGTDPLMRSLGFLEAFDCSQEMTKRDSVDLTQVGECNKDDYMAYETEQPITMELLHHKTTEEVLLNACQLEIELATAYCRPGNYLSLWTGLGWSSPSAGGGNGLDGFATTLKEDFIVSEHVCRNTWKTGQFEINLGRQQISIAVPQGEPSHTRTSLYLHGSTYGQNFNCSPVYGWSASGPVYRGQDNQFSEKVSHEVTRAILTLKLKKVFSLLDTSKGKLYVPSAGKELDVQSMGQEYSTSSPSVGTIIILKGNLPLDKCRQHFHIAGGPAGLYAPKDSKSNDVPKLIRFETNIQGDKRVFGLQQLGEVDVCGAACHSTQFKEIVICMRNSPTDFIKRENREVLNDLGSSSVSLLQVNVDRSIQHLMWNLCLIHRKHQLVALRDIERHGPSLLSPINNGRGIKVVARGEQAIALECPRTTAIPRSEQHVCCSNFPVTLIRPDGSTTDKYLQSVSRQITDLCDPVPCSEVLPIQMRTISGNSICQFKGHIRNCNKPTILQPKDEVGGKLKLLSASEQKLSAIQGALPSQIELWSIISNVRLKAADEMIGRISQQTVKCTGNYCSSDPIDDEFRKNFARSSLPFTMHYFTFSTTLQFLAALAVVLFYYEKITGLLSIIVSIHTCCRNGGTTTTKTSFCTMMLKGFCVLSKACNPLHPRNIEEEFKLEKMKRRVKKIQSEHREFVAEQASLLQEVSCETSPNPQMNDEALNELRNTVRLLWLEVDDLKRMVDNTDTATGLMGSRQKTKFKRNPTGKRSRGLRKYPRIFTTPPVKKRTPRGVRFDIQDTEF